MPRPAPLPSELPPVFTVSEALALGVSRGRLTRSDLRRPFHGVRAIAGPPADTVRGGCLELAPRLRPWQFFSHETALLLLGAPTPEWPYRPAIHVSAHRPSREPRIDGVIGHRLQTRMWAAIDDEALGAIEHPVRAWRQAATHWGLDDLIAAADFLVSGDRPMASIADLGAEIDTMGDYRAGILRQARVWVRTGVRSARETRLRMLLVRAGLPEPAVAWDLRDPWGTQIAELDLAYPRWRVAPEYDGRVHADDPAQFARDADRWDRIRDAGWDHVRVLNHHMRGSGVVAVRKVRDALLRAGWRPGR